MMPRPAASDHEGGPEPNHLVRKPCEHLALPALYSYIRSLESVLHKFLDLILRTRQDRAMGQIGNLGLSAKPAQYAGRSGTAPGLVRGGAAGLAHVRVAPEAGLRWTPR